MSILAGNKKMNLSKKDFLFNLMENLNMCNYLACKIVHFTHCGELVKDN